MSILAQTNDAIPTAFVFDTIKRICKKYRSMSRSDDLFREIIYIMKECFKQICSTAKQCFQQIMNNANQD